MSIAPTGREMAGIRRDARRLLPDNVAIYRPTFVDDGYAGRTEAYAFVSEGPGRIAQMGGAEQEFFGQRVGLSQGWIVSITPDREVRPTDQLRVGSRQLEVVATNFGTSGSWLQRVVTREIS